MTVNTIHKACATTQSNASDVPRDPIFARPLTGILWSCDAEQQGTESEVLRVCDTNLEPTTGNCSRRFYFNEQFQWTFES